MEVRQGGSGAEPAEDELPNDGPSISGRVAGGDELAELGGGHQDVAGGVFEEQWEGLGGQAVDGGVEAGDAGKDDVGRGAAGRQEVAVMDTEDAELREGQAEGVRGDHSALPFRDGAAGPGQRRADGRDTPHRGAGSCGWRHRAGRVQGSWPRLGNYPPRIRTPVPGAALSMASLAEGV